MTSEDARKLFVAGLSESIDENVLRALFEGTGTTIVSISLPRDRATGRLRGFGFVTLATEDEAEKARGVLDGTIHSGRAISVRRFHNDPPKRADARAEPTASAPSSEGSTLYVGNLPYDVTQAELEALFVQGGFGSIVRLHMPLSPEGRSRGFGFVALGSPDAAQRAVQALHQSDLRGRRLIVNLAHAKPDRAERTPLSERPVRRAHNNELPRDSVSRPSEPPPSRGAPGGPSFTGDFEESARPVEGRRARATEVKKKTKKTKRRAVAEDTRHDRSARGGAGSWQKWTDWDED
jgi:nucleolin